MSLVKPDTESAVRIREVMNLLDRVQEIHARILRGQYASEDEGRASSTRGGNTDEGRRVRQLIRRLVEEWV